MIEFVGFLVLFFVWDFAGDEYIVMELKIRLLLLEERFINQPKGESK